MLPSFLDRLTPRTNPRTQLLTAAFFWGAVGFFLTAKGLYLSRAESWPLVAAAAVLGLVLGAIKSRMVFQKVARKIIERILKKNTRTCLGGLFSIRNWLLIVAMMVLGRAIGSLTIPVELKTVIYVTVGSGLAISSRLMWQAWRRPVLLGNLRMK